MEGCNNYGAGTPPADWLVRGVCSTPGPVATRRSASQILPNAFPAAFSTLNSQSNVTQGSHGQLTLLEQDAMNVDPSAAIPTSIEYFDTTGTVRARVFAATNTSSGEVGYRALPTGSPLPSYSTAATTTGTLTLGLQSSTFALKSGDTAPLDFNGNRYMALEVSGSDDSKLTDIIGLRFFSTSLIPKASSSTPSLTVAFTLNQAALKVVLANSFVPALGAQFKILSGGSLSGTFSTVTMPQLPSGLAWDTSTLYTSGTITVVPSAAPTISITSGGNQSVTLPATARPVAFTLDGIGPLTVAAER
jgi:hypothetical protein